LNRLARDGGLYVPNDPDTQPPRNCARCHDAYEDVAFRVMENLGDTFSDEEFKALIAKAYAGSITRSLPHWYQLEQATSCRAGPRPHAAFQGFRHCSDSATCFRPCCHARAERVTIVGADSGRLRLCAIEAFRGLDNVAVFILFPPWPGVRPVQRRQDDHAIRKQRFHAAALDGDFDDCQRV